MNYKLLLALLLASFVKSYAGDLTTVLIGENNTPGIIVPDGKVLEIESYKGDFTYYIPGATEVRYNVQSGVVLNQNYMIGTQRFSGPGVLNYYSSNGALVTYRLKDNISSTTTTPTSAVVIPTDATGPVNIILESSTDLVTWTAANPGTYGASTTKRFFRVRAVNQ